MANAKPAAELDDVMLAMDVVDTIRHRELIVERELNSEQRREQLMAKLKSLYAAQGLDVPDHILAEGVTALEEDRFAYTPPDPGLQTTLAKCYVRRSRWGKPLLGILAFALVIFLAWQFFVVRPEATRIAALPTTLQTTYESALAVASVDSARERAGALFAEGESAIARGDEADVTESIKELEALRGMLETSYELRVVSRPGELSGVWRVPEANPGARNYYLIVEAVDGSGNTLAMPIRNEEDGQVYTVRKWGVRVDQSIFDRIAADKRDDGIIQDYILGTKERGALEPNYRIETSGAAITQW